MDTIMKSLIIEDSGRNIPKAKYIKNIESLIGDLDPVIGRNAARELLTKFVYIERSILSKLHAMESKEIELKNSLFSLEKLFRKEKLDLYFKVEDTLYAEAHVPVSDTVFLWLGAGTMVEYPIEEAIELIKKNQDGVKTTISEMKSELEWVREQITVTEVNVSRIHNYCVQKAAVTPATSSKTE